MMLKKKILLLIAALIPYVDSLASSSVQLQEYLLKLDEHISKSDVFVSEKRARINALQDALKYAEGEQIYDISYDLYEEYRSFKYDSADFYANKVLDLALKANDRDRIVQSRCALVFCYLSSGLFLEAFDEIKRVNIKGVSGVVKQEYYALYNRLYYDASDFNNTRNWSLEYTKRGTEYVDSLKAIVPKDSYQYQFIDAQCMIKHWHYKECISGYQKLLKDFVLDDHTKAIINSSIGGAYKALGQVDSSMVYLAKAAIYDITSATKETTALYRLAEMICQIGEYDRAYTYIHAAMADADFYNARHRKLSINPILPIIEQARIESFTRQRNLMILVILLCVMTLLVLATAVIIFRKQHKKLKKRSLQLSEANRIKEEYIGYSFYINSEFINEFEDLYNTINQKLSAKQYSDLRDITKLSKINKKRESMYESFDKCFLKIFPSFVSEYAGLFPEGMVDVTAVTLTSEMRIFALIRLGISDSEKIARFLNYSVHTIYTYKTRAKNKSIVGNEEFEKRIKSVEIA